MLTGYFRRQEQEWDRARSIMAYVATFAFGQTKPVQPQDVRRLQMDSDGEKRMITSMHMAMQLLKEFMAV